MSETTTHFVAVCPSCLTSLRVRCVYDGAHVRCKHCRHKFLAISSGASEAETDESRDVHDQYMVVSCPSCETALEIRRESAGQNERCSHCLAIFLVEDVVRAPGSWTSAPDRQSPRPIRGLPSPDEMSNRDEGIGPRSCPADVEDELVMLRVDHDRLEAELAARDEELSRLRIERDEARARWRSAIKELNVLGERVRVLEAGAAEPGAQDQDGREPARADDRWPAPAGEGLDMLAQAAALAAERDRLAEIADSLEQELRAAREDGSRLADDLRIHRESLRSAREVRHRVEGELASLKSEREEAAGTVASLQAELSEAARGRSIAEADLEAAREEIAALRRQHGETQSSSRSMSTMLEGIGIRLALRQRPAQRAESPPFNV